MSALKEACRINNTEAIKALIESKANLVLQDDYGNTALTWLCCGRNNIEVVAFMLETSQ